MKKRIENKNEIHFEKITESFNNFFIFFLSI